jgi:prepilin-type N-terminal cleavage/methylation domain-containing protein
VGSLRRGFTLLEVMVAMTILALAMVALSALLTTTITMNATVHRSTTAAHLIHWAMTDLELEFKKDGFPSNDVEGRDCELPKDLERVFECEYALKRMDITPEQVSEMGMGSMGNLFGENMENMNSMTDSLKNAHQTGGLADPQLASTFNFAAPFFGPEGEYLMQMCPINWDQIMMALMGTQMFLPQVVEFAADRIRKMTVTIRWKEGFKGERELFAEVFVTSLPEELVKAAEEATELQNLQEQLTP